MKKILFIIILLTVSCGYKPIYLNNDQLINKFNEVILEGDNEINRKIKNTLNFEKNTNNNQKLMIKTDYKIEVTSRNSKGHVETYRSIINTQLIVKNGDEILQTKNFILETSYNNNTNKFELTKNQNEIKNNLLNRLIEEIILYLSLV
jgi:hypothetical protein